MTNPYILGPGMREREPSQETLLKFLDIYCIFLRDNRAGNLGRLGFVKLRSAIILRFFTAVFPSALLRTYRDGQRNGVL